VKHQYLEETYIRIMEDIRTKMPIDGQSAYYLPGMAYMYEKTTDPTWAAYCQFVLEWHRHGLEAEGGSDFVMRDSLGVPDFSFGFVSGYLAVAIAVVTEARARGDDLEAAMQRLRDDRARALGKDPATTDALYYIAPYFGWKPAPWYRPGPRVAQ
jgi:hypothetical protein